VSKIVDSSSVGFINQPFVTQQGVDGSPARMAVVVRREPRAKLGAPGGVLVRGL